MEVFVYLVEVLCEPQHSENQSSPLSSNHSKQHFQNIQSNSMTTTKVISAAAPTPLTSISPIRLNNISFMTSVIPRRRRRSAYPPLRCDVAIRPDSAASVSDSDDYDDEVKSSLEKVGSKVKVKSPMKVHHVPRLPDVEITPDMEGVVKQYVGFWKGKRITANYPFKVEFTINVEDRGNVKFAVHLREDEFDFVN